MISGQYQYRHPVGLYDPLPRGSRLGYLPQAQSLPRLFAQAGYRTALVGKWHLGALPDFGPLRSGYDEFFGPMESAMDYVSHRPMGAGAAAASMLYDGEHLYPLLTVEYLLDLGLTQPAQVTHAHKAARHIEPEEWRRTCAVIKEACVKAYHEDSCMGNYKLLINSAIGLMNRVDRFAYPMVRRGIYDDLQRPNFLSCDLMDNSLPSVATQTRLLSARAA